jgi:hypothetical protein
MVMYLRDRSSESSQGSASRRTPGGFSTRTAASTRLCDQEAADCPPYCPPSGTAPGRSAPGQLVGPLEAVNRLLVGEEYPAGGEIDGWITCTQVAEIDYAAEVAILGEDVGWVQIPVQPDRWPGPPRRGDCVMPDRLDSVRVRNQPQLS